MRDHDLFKANVANLSAFWCALGAETTALPSGAPLHRSLGWPDRLWFGGDHRPDEADRRLIVTSAAASPAERTVPIWRPLEADSSGAEMLRMELERAGFAVAFAQTAMHKDLDDVRPGSTGTCEVTFTDGRHDVQQWADVAARSFAYAIDARSVIRLCDSPHAYLVVAHRAGTPVGTGVLFRTGDVAGIHMVGVPPEARRAGIAGAIMARLLDEARRLGCRRATLQASSMGEGLYAKLGFTVSGHVDNLRPAHARPEERS